MDADSRQEILEVTLPFIESGNAGLDDMLYDVAYATCYDDVDLRSLAQDFEAMKSEWKTAHARRIYRRLGDRDKYLELRAQQMEYGADYHDLATDGLTLEKYQAFNKLCSAEEWSLFEPKILLQLKQAGAADRLKIRMHRKEHDESLAILTKGRYPIFSWAGEYEIQVAEKLEKRYPEKILKYYLSGLSKLDRNAERKEYARNAKVMVKVRQDWSCFIRLQSCGRRASITSASKRY